MVSIYYFYDGFYFLMPEFAACCVCAIVCILLLEDSISDSIQPDSYSCEISRRPSLLKEGIIKDGISDPLNGNLFLNKIFNFAYLLFIENIFYFWLLNNNNLVFFFIIEVI